MDENAHTARILAATRGHTGLPTSVLDRIIDGENPLAVLIAYRGMSEAEVAKDCFLSRAFISKLAGGDVRAARETVMNLCRVLNVNEDVLEGIAG